MFITNFFDEKWDIDKRSSLIRLCRFYLMLCIARRSFGEYLIENNNKSSSNHIWVLGFEDGYNILNYNLTL